MRKILALCCLGFVWVASPQANAQVGFDDDIWLRGDANSDGERNLTDITTINNWLFLGGDAPPCLNQADANNDGAVTVTDSVYLSNFLYNGGPTPPPPSFPLGSSCGVDDSPYPGCALSPCA